MKVNTKGMKVTVEDCLAVDKELQAFIDEINNKYEKEAFSTSMPRQKMFKELEQTMDKEEDE